MLTQFSSQFVDWLIVAHELTPKECSRDNWMEDGRIENKSQPGQNTVNRFSRQEVYCE